MRGEETIHDETGFEYSDDSDNEPSESDHYHPNQEGMDQDDMEEDVVNVPTNVDEDEAMSDVVTHSFATTIVEMVRSGSSCPLNITSSTDSIAITCPTNQSQVTLDLSPECSDIIYISTLDGVLTFNINRTEEAVRTCLTELGTGTNLKDIGQRIIEIIQKKKPDFVISTGADDSITITSSRDCVTVVFAGDFPDGTIVTQEGKTPIEVNRKLRTPQAISEFLLSNFFLAPSPPPPSPPSAAQIVQPPISNVPIKVLKPPVVINPNPWLYVNGLVHITPSTAPCTICQSELLFKPVATLNGCCHTFHVDCIKDHHNCVTCGLPCSRTTFAAQLIKNTVHKGSLFQIFSTENDRVLEIATTRAGCRYFYQIPNDELGRYLCSLFECAFIHDRLFEEESGPPELSITLPYHNTVMTPEAIQLAIEFLSIRISNIEHEFLDPIASEYFQLRLSPEKSFQEDLSGYCCECCQQPHRAWATPARLVSSCARPICVQNIAENRDWKSIRFVWDVMAMLLGIVAEAVASNQFNIPLPEIPDDFDQLTRRSELFVSIARSFPSVESLTIPTPLDSRTRAALRVQSFVMSVYDITLAPFESTFRIDSIFGSESSFYLGNIRFPEFPPGQPIQKELFFLTCRRHNWHRILKSQLVLGTGAEELLHFDDSEVRLVRTLSPGNSVPTIIGICEVFRTPSDPEQLDPRNVRLRALLNYKQPVPVSNQVYLNQSISEILFEMDVRAAMFALLDK
eukprot:c9232_g1_i1.p1 GENE.c9232_g1_i1~~c9232_g1_i1.p1  ORF type:complete len:740 (-),score=152.33 c9232_g1_i1:55-2274(-)